MTGSAAANAALAELIALWAQTKDPGLAERIAGYAQAHETPAAKPLREQPKIKQPQWLAALTEVELVDRGAVLASLAGATAAQVAQRIVAMAELRDDPRMADALHELIRTVPWTSTGARKVWTRCFATLVEIGDPRTIEIARGFDPSKIGAWSEAAGEWMRERLAKLADTIEAELSTRELTEAEVDRVEALAGAAAVELQPSRAEATLAELLAQAMADPDDLDARLVLADALTDAGDARGELIRVQVARESAPADKPLARREKQLLTEHRDRLLGALGPVVVKGSLVWRRGFVDACSFAPGKHAELIAAALAEPQVATIRVLGAPIEVVLDPRLISLREVCAWLPADTSAAPLLRCARSLPFTAVNVRLQPGDELLLDGCTCLPALVRLTLDGDHEVVLAAITRELTRRVQALHLLRPALERVAELLEAALAELPELATLSFRVHSLWETEWGGTMTISRAADGLPAALHGRLEVKLPGPKWEAWMGRIRVMGAIGLAVAGVRGIGLASLTVSSAKAIRDPEIRERLLATVHEQVDRPEAITWEL